MNRRDLIVRHDLDLYNRAPREPHPLHRNPRVIRSSYTFGPSSRSSTALSSRSIRWHTLQ